MKNTVATVLLAVLLVAGGCGSIEDPKQPVVKREHTFKPKEELSVEESFDGISSEKQNKLKELLSHFSYIIGAVLSHNYFGDVGDQELWQNARRNELRADYVKFHNLFGEEMSNPKDFSSLLWEIDNYYLKAITSMEMKELDTGGLQTNKEGLKEPFEELFSSFLTKKAFKEYCGYSDAEERLQRFRKYEANGFEYKEGLFNRERGRG